MLNKILFATALTMIGAAASATSYDWGQHASAESNPAYVLSGAFSDDYTFSLGSAEQVTSSAVSLNLLSIYAITGGSYSLWMDGGAAGPDGHDTELGNWSFDGTTGSTSNTMNLGPGNYFYMVTGTATGSGDPAHNAGIYDIASTIVPVPEPESYALLLGGLALVGFVAGRRDTRR